MSERLIRTFISVPVPQSVFAVRNSLKETVVTKGAKIKWIPNDNYHLTLKFIGDMPEDEVEKVNQVIKNTISQHSSMSMSISGTGCFPKKERPRIFWVGINGDLSPLQSMVTDLNDALDPMGYPKETKEFVPHLTIARVKYPQKHTPDITPYLDADYEPIPFEINKIHFMRSQLFFKGSVYTILDTHFLTNNNV